MSGHSKWANIKHRKERSDKQKGKVFSRVAKEIISAVKQGGSDPRTNAKLKLVIQKAKNANFPNDNIDRNIKKAASADQQDYYELTYELYGYGGVGIIVDIMTDNKNRIASEIRIATNKCGGTIASPNSVAFNFDRKGIIQVAQKDILEEELFLIASESGAQDFDIEEDLYIVTTAVEDLYKVKEAIEKIGITPQADSLEMIPKTYIQCNEDDEKSNNALIQWIEDLDDVDAVYHNMETSSE